MPNDFREKKRQELLGTPDLRGNNRVTYGEHGRAIITAVDPTKVWTEESLHEFFEETDRRYLEHSERLKREHAERERLPKPAKERVGPGAWYFARRNLRTAWCLLSGGHQSTGNPYGLMNCARCWGTLYQHDWRDELRGLHPRRLLWGTINHWREWIAPWGLEHPRLAALLGLWVCPDCGNIATPKEKGDCDPCAFMAIQKHCMAEVAASRRRRPRRKRLAEESSPNTEAESEKDV